MVDMVPLLRIVLPRHGQSEGNVRTINERVALGKPVHAYALTDIGRIQARALGDWLAHRISRQWRGAAVYASPYVRAWDTACEALAGAGIIEDNLLIERETGIWGTLSAEDMQARYADEIARAKRMGWYWYRPPGGESGPDVERRFRQFVQMLPGTAETVIAFTHEQFIRLAWRWATGASIAEGEALWGTNAFPNCSVTILERQPGSHLWQCIQRGYLPPEVSGVH